MNDSERGLGPDERSLGERAAKKAPKSPRESLDTGAKVFGSGVKVLKQFEPILPRAVRAFLGLVGLDMVQALGKFVKEVLIAISATQQVERTIGFAEGLAAVLTFAQFGYPLETLRSSFGRVPEYHEGFAKGVSEGKRILAELTKEKPPDDVEFFGEIYKHIVETNPYIELVPTRASYEATLRDIKEASGFR